ncbi:hypothetical protein [Thomasclavelia sp.]|uniref:hypothetical protein n=1 Tax=Thomasclavelia sp. TaxID=3025757 RepID=UPI0025E5E3BA|nr:hypothetical protein [Thomasclavelia sp.]
MTKKDIFKNIFKVDEEFEIFRSIGKNTAKKIGDWDFYHPDDKKNSLIGTKVRDIEDFRKQ